ncbi:hypothetical protein F2Q68_00002058 [Brassica cretica]|uniref:Uncharacterized protein n=1 Tax=Brassica cretica TaxID=69181 RepID=A0A8S9JIR5_BRACR|nr:hypothetical protein F2Q68_00002058 [Brassica cretica]
MNLTPEIRNRKIPVEEEEEEEGGEAEGPLSSAKARREKALERFSIHFVSVFDTPYLPVLVGKRVRKRLDAKSIVQLIRSLDIPSGSTAYIEQSTPFPKDGKQGWYSGGFGFGFWIGTLVTSGFSVVPVPSALWKRYFQLAGGNCTKDDSRRVASELFPLLSSQLQRKKDHGRAEALLIAAYGETLKHAKLLYTPQEFVSTEIALTVRVRFQQSSVPLLFDSVEQLLRIRGHGNCKFILAYVSRARQMDSAILKEGSQHGMLMNEVPGTRCTVGNLEGVIFEITLI